MGDMTAENGEKALIFKNFKSFWHEGLLNTYFSNIRSLYVTLLSVVTKLIAKKTSLNAIINVFHRVNYVQGCILDYHSALFCRLL